MLRNSFFSQFVSGVLSFSLPLALIPLWAFAPGPVKTAKSLPLRQMPEAPKMLASRDLTPDEIRTKRGRTNDLYDANPYVAGTNKWDVVHNGVNLVTGNFTTSATDLSFEGGYGIPVNITRSYSANNPDEGPFGIGWTISVDVRSTAGGILKSSGAPIRSVPIQFKERPSTQDDPAVPYASEPVDAVVSTDASGKETTVQRDVDGVLTTPPWDKNEIESHYEMVIDGENIYEVLVSNTVRTPEGTIYEYTKQGEFTGGQYEYNNSGQSTFTPSNVLKIVSATDRNENETTYHYDSEDTVTFIKYNGAVEEHPLISIEMPGGRELNFEWEDERISEINDGVGDGHRTVTYEYDEDGMLETVTSPEGRETNYAYDGATGGGPETPQTSEGLKLLTSITDCRDLETVIHYCVSEAVPVLPYNVPVRAIVAFQVDLPNGNKTYTKKFGSGAWPITAPTGSIASNVDYTDWDSSSHRLEEGKLWIYSYNSGTLDIRGGFGTGNGTFELSPAFWIKKYSEDTYDCFYEQRVVDADPLPNGVGGKTSERYFSNGMGTQTVTTETDFNCFGAPLSKTVTEDAYGSDNDRATTVEYAYWGANKYYQERAVRAPKEGSGFRYSFTDYFDDSEDAELRGQTKRVWGPDVFGTPLDTEDEVPEGTDSGDEWKYNFYPANYDPEDDRDESDCSAEFDYDEKGRVTDTWKIPAAGPNGTYVRTVTTYDDGDFGLAKTVTEGYGTGNARTTTTDEYDVIGRATVVTDALGREYTTTYNRDGQTISIEKTGGPGDEGSLIEYSYGSSGPSNGMVTFVQDVVSGYGQDISYISTGGGIGQIDQVTEYVTVEAHSSEINSVKYTYTDAGERATAHYYTPNGTTHWRYSDYTFVGFVGGFKRVFQTLNKQQEVEIESVPTWVDSSEEMHFDYDFSGRLVNTAFAQYVDTGDSADGWNPETLFRYYPAGHPAEKRIVSHTEYDAAGRGLFTRTASYNQTEYLGSASGFAEDDEIFENVCVYSDDLGLKISSENVHKTSTGASVTNGSWTEVYDGYDPNLDYLQSVDYNDGRSNETPTWTYDYAGNRSNAGYTYDNLNRMTTAPGSKTYINDAVGNRIARNYTPGQAGQPSTDAQMYNWDDFNRMTATAGPTEDSGYRNVFRADGMRVQKISDISLEFTENQAQDDGSGFYDDITWVDKPTTRYFYDGQMCMEDELTETVEDAPRVTTTKYGLGARGIDYIERKVGVAGATVGFPVYDCHGNMVMTLSRSGGAWADGLHRAYDVWGGIRWNPSTSSDIKQRYCANVGHIMDDESGLEYMRARFYEPATGRFLSQDPGMQGRNWFTYCGNDPVNRLDISGREWDDIMRAIALAIAIFMDKFGPGGPGISGPSSFPIDPKAITRKIAKDKEDEDKLNNLFAKRLGEYRIDSDTMYEDILVVGCFMFAVAFVEICRAALAWGMPIILDSRMVME